MPRKHNYDNPLEMDIEATSLPLEMIPLKTDSVRVQRAKMYRYWRMLYNVARKRGRMHPEAHVTLWWVNAESMGQSREWDSDTFENAVRESNEGFNSILVEAIVSEMEKYRP